MSDEALRRAVRAAGVSGEAAPAIAAARALERAGQRDEALAALWPHRAHPEVRPELARHPGWSHPHGDAGWTRSHDGPIPRSAPHVRWSVQLEGPAEALLASPCGIAVGTRHATQVFDPDEGTRLALVRGTCLAWAGERLVVRPPAPFPEVWWMDLADQRVASLALGRHSFQVDGSFVVATNGGDLTAYQVPGDPLWTAGRTGHGAAIALGPERVVATAAEGKVAVFERAHGGERFRGEASRAMVDRGGIVTGHPRHGVIARDADGSRLWSAGAATPWACDARVVLAIDGVGLVVLERERGRTRARVPAEGIASALLARDAIVWWRTDREGLNRPGERRDPCLAAATTDGRALWRLELEELEEQVPEHVVPLAGRLYLLSASHRLVCLEA